MARGQVTVNNLNLGQGATPEIERTFLFLGQAPKNNGVVLSLSAESDFDDLLGAADSVLKTNLEAARVNGGTNWAAYAIPMPANADHEDYLLAFKEANATYFKSTSVEAVVVLRPCTVADELNDWQESIMLSLAQFARQMFVICAAPGVGADQSWSEYEAALSTMVSSVAANRVSVTPQLHGNDCGVVSGRLCHAGTSVADSPMRVATGALIGLGEIPADKDGVVLPESTLITLSAARFSTVQHYADFPGTYWADASTLDAPGGDYQVLDYLRPVLKACRAVRIQAIQRIADRNFNDTPESIAYHKGYFGRVLRAMSKNSTVDVGDETLTLVGDIEPPGKNAVTIVWNDKTSVSISLVVTPYNSPKDITVNVVLDLSAE